jgi:glycine oxidase
VERLSAGAARDLEPAISPAVRLALRFPEDHQVENRSLARALWSAAARAGARVRTGAPVRALVRRGGRMEGVETVDGERIVAGAVVLATGSWAAGIEGLPRPLPVVPVHGQLLAFASLPPLIEHVVDSPRCYLVPRADGRVIAGTTVERVGFRTHVTAAGIMVILRGAIEAVPALADLALAELWSGLRPGTPDDLPILGADPEVANLFYATGHYRNGILLAPITGAAIGELALGRDPGVRLDPFGVDRFGRG